MTCYPLFQMQLLLLPQMLLRADVLGSSSKGQVRGEPAGWKVFSPQALLLILDGHPRRIHVTEAKSGHACSANVT